jgi:hypothetical protein
MNYRCGISCVICFHDKKYIVISYANIYLKDSILFCIVLIINIKLTNSYFDLNAFLCVYFVKYSTKMDFTSANINKFLFFKLPSAFLCGVRARYIDDQRCEVTVRHRWINQNPFNSMYFAVQAMAAELSTGALTMSHIRKSERKVSMLVANNKCQFSKKATGKITFTCTDGKLISKAISEAIKTGEGQTCWMKSIGVNEKGEAVSELHFEWTVKVK